MNYLTIFGVVLLQIILNSVWYGPIFGKFWMIVNGHENATKEEMAELSKGMGLLYGAQALLTILTTVFTAIVVNSKELSGYSWYYLAGFIWLGFMMPIIVQTELWGPTKKELKLKKTLIIISQLLLSTLISAFFLRNFR
jgi:Protein of unknown function (DUF1761)